MGDRVGGTVEMRPGDCGNFIRILPGYGMDTAGVLSTPGHGVAEGGRPAM